MVCCGERVKLTAVLSIPEIEERQWMRAEEVKDVLGLSKEECLLALRHYRFNKQQLMEAWMKDPTATRIAVGIGHTEERAS